MKKIKALAIGGVVAALSVVLSFLGGIIPAAVFFAPVIAGFLLVFLKELYGMKNAVMTFVVVAVLMFLIAPKKAGAFAYAYLFGYYPIVFSEFDRIKSSVVKAVAKIAVFELVGVAALGSILLLMPTVKNEEKFTLILVAGIIGFNIFALVYDRFLFFFFKVFGDTLRDRLKKFKG